VKNLGEEADPEDLEAEPERAGSRGHDAKPGGRGDPRGRGRRCSRIAVTHRERDSGGERARARDRDVAPRDADRRRQPESHRRDPDRGAERVHRVEKPASPADVGRGERLPEHGQRRAEEDRRRENRGSNRDGSPGPRRGERTLSSVTRQEPERRERPERARGDAELEQAVADHGTRRCAACERRAGPESGEVRREDGRRRRRGRADDEPGGAQPEELEPERRGAGDGEAEPEHPAHDAVSCLPRPSTWCAGCSR
jgi:hypothetical protein